MTTPWQYGRQFFHLFVIGLVGLLGFLLSFKLLYLKCQSWIHEGVSKE